VRLWLSQELAGVDGVCRCKRVVWGRTSARLLQGDEENHVAGDALIKKNSLRPGNGAGLVQLTRTPRTSSRGVAAVELQGGSGGLVRPAAQSGQSERRHQRFGALPAASADSSTTGANACGGPDRTNASARGTWFRPLPQSWASSIRHWRSQQDRISSPIGRQRPLQLDPPASARRLGSSR